MTNILLDRTDQRRRGGGVYSIALAHRGMLTCGAHGAAAVPAEHSEYAEWKLCRTGLEHSIAAHDADIILYRIA
jgi:hypothetical protein